MSNDPRPEKSIPPTDLEHTPPPGGPTLGAKLAAEGQLLYLRYLGTDLPLFQKSFSIIC